MNKFKTYLLYSWYYYVIYAIIITVIWVIIFSILTNPKKNEEINIFISAFQVNSEALEEILVEDFRGTKIKTVNVDFAASDDSYFGYVFATRGMVNTDIVIVNESILTSGMLGRYFKALNSDILSAYLPKTREYEYLEEAGQIYGILVYDPDNLKGSIFTDLIKYEREDTTSEKYYLFFNKKSVNLGEMNQDHKNYVDNGALIALRKLFSYQPEDK